MDKSRGRMEFSNKSNTGITVAHSMEAWMIRIRYSQSMKVGAYRISNTFNWFTGKGQSVWGYLVN